jgi:hypothetical protein
VHLLKDALRRFGFFCLGYLVAGFVLCLPLAIFLMLLGDGGGFAASLFEKPQAVVIAVMFVTFFTTGITMLAIAPFAFGFFVLTEIFFFLTRNVWAKHPWLYVGAGGVAGFYSLHSVNRTPLILFIAAVVCGAIAGYILWYVERQADRRLPVAPRAPNAPS